MHTLQDLEGLAFEFSDLWKLAGVSKTLAQNWTNERPLRIWPSVMRADGKGTRNLYNIYDAYLLAYLDLLRRKGLSIESLKRVVPLLTWNTKGQKPTLVQNFGEESRWLVISLTKMVVMTEPVKPTAETNNVETGPLQLNEFHDDIGIQVAVNLVKLRAEVNARAAKILSEKRRSGG